MLVERSINEYVGLLASEAPAPGGGSASAVAGALGAALVKMVGCLTEGRENYAEHADFNARLLERSQQIIASFLELADEDVVVFNKMSSAYKMPKATKDEKDARKNAIQSALRACAETPYKMMELCAQALELTWQAIGKTNGNVASDLGVAAVCLKAAMQGAWLNVAVNLGSIKDPVFSESYRTKGEALLLAALPLADKIYADILMRI